MHNVKEMFYIATNTDGNTVSFFSTFFLIDVHLLSLNAMPSINNFIFRQKTKCEV